MKFLWVFPRIFIKEKTFVDFHQKNVRHKTRKVVRLEEVLVLIGI